MALFYRTNNIVRKFIARPSRKTQVPDLQDAERTVSRRSQTMLRRMFRNRWRNILNRGNSQPRRHLPASGGKGSPSDSRDLEECTFPKSENVAIKN